MKKIIDYIAEELADAFEKAGYDRAYGKVTLSIVRIFVNTSVTVQWREQKLIKRHRS